MSTSLYSEALNAAEELKYATEEKVKQNLIEAMTPQIKLMVEQNIMSEVNSDECGYESLEENEEVDTEDDEVNPRTTRVGGGSMVNDDKTADGNVELSKEARNIFSKIIDINSRRDAFKSKLQEVKKNIKALKKAVLLAEGSKNKTIVRSRINQIYKNLIQEMKNISSYDIIKKDKELLNDFYKVIKELNNMSRRRTKRSRYLNEDLETLLEMNLFEDDDTEEEEDTEKVDDTEDEDLEGMGDEDWEGDMDADEDVLSAGDMSSEVTPETTVGELALMAGIVEEGDEGVDEEMGEELEDVDIEGEDIGDIGESFYESDGYQEETDEGLTSSELEGFHESSRRRGDLFLEIDENMLKREISKMKRLREGEAKDMASHFGGGSLEGEMFVDGVELNKLHEMKIKAAKVVRQNRRLNRKLSEYKKALRGMKGQLAEMNLFNAKLLYANKLMQNKDLSMKQQRHIVESLDEAKTLGEAKILFESLSKGLVRRTKNTGGRKLTEGRVRRTSGASSRPVRSAQKLNESVALDRWATLAGIKK